MEEIIKATAENAQQLAGLYRKAFEEIGFREFTTPEKRGELITWLQELGEAGKLWFITDDQGPVTFAHYEADKDEVITIATRDDMERKGYAKRILRALVVKYPTLKLRPVTSGGKAIAAKCGFVPSQEDKSRWISNDAQTPRC
jgi:hypothetical protein